MKKKSTKLGPRQAPSRDDWYMGQAFWIASKSKDPSTQNGAIIVADNVPIGTGYNGPPSQYDDDDLDWSRPSKDDPSSPSKYDHMTHAEGNALDHCLLPLLLPGSTIWVTARPCKICMLRIAHKHLKKVIYFPLHLHKDPESMVTKDVELIEDIARRGKVELCQFKGNLNWMRDRILFMEELGIF